MRHKKLHRISTKEVNVETYVTLRNEGQKGVTFTYNILAYKIVDDHESTIFFREDELDKAKEWLDAAHTYNVEYNKSTDVELLKQQIKDLREGIISTLNALNYSDTKHAVQDGHWNVEKEKELTELLKKTSNTQPVVPCPKCKGLGCYPRCSDCNNTLTKQQQ